jgi:hypothetical protein
LGRIPFRLRFGVVGHRELPDEDRLAEAVRDQLRAIWDGRLGIPGTGGSLPIELAVVSALAKGADRIVVREVIAEAKSRGHEARLEVILPMERDEYSADQAFSGSVLREYNELLRQATSVTELPGGRGSSRYKRAGQGVVDRCDVLLALWGGGPSKGEGGSAETLLYAAARWRPCIWISTLEDHRVRDNLERGSAGDFLEEVRRRANVDHQRGEIGEASEPEPESVLAPLLETYRWLCDFNVEQLTESFSNRLDRELYAPNVDVRWVAAPYLRATTAAARYQRWFTLATWIMALLATLIAATVAFSIALDVAPKLWAWLKVGLIVLLLAVFLYTHSRRRVHKRWLSYRLLAERLRSARYLGATGVDFPRLAGLSGVFVEQQSANWVQRAFEEVWDSRPTAGRAQRLTKGDAEALKTWLADEWIQRQIDYHRRAADMHERRERLFTRITAGLFLLTLGVVLARAIPETFWTTSEALDRTTLFLAIVLPAAGASMGAILTVRQHHALAERFRRMHAELAEVRWRILDSDKDSLQGASSEAARVIAEEGGDWFGAMWFLDIKHPP